MSPVPPPVRVLLTWTAILPLVLLAQAALRPLVATWPTPAGTALTITVVVPVAVLVVVPALTRGWLALTGRP